MRRSYQIAERKDSEALAEFLAQEGQLLMPMVQLVEEAGLAVDELIDVVGRATIEAVLLLSAEQVAGPKQRGKRGPDREAYWHGSQPGTVGAAEAICGSNGVEGIPDLLDQLAERSLVLVKKQGDELRYEMPTFVWPRAQQHLHAASEAADIGHRHRAFFLQLAENSHDGLSGPKQAVWLRRLEADHANLLEAAGNSGDPEEANTSLRIIVALGRFWGIGGRLEEGRQITERALAEFGAKANPVVTARALVAAARLGVRAGEIVAPETGLGRAEQLFRAAGERGGIAEVLSLNANVALRRGDYSRARAQCEQSLSLLRELDDKRGIAWSLLTLGEVAYRNGDNSASLEFREQALALFREVADLRGLAWALTNVGKSAFRKGNLVAAHARHAEGWRFTWSWETGLGQPGLLVLWPMWPWLWRISARPARSWKGASSSRSRPGMHMAWLGCSCIWRP